MQINLRNETFTKLAIMANNKDISMSCLLEKVIIARYENTIHKKNRNEYQKIGNKSKILSCLVVPKFQKQIATETGINLSTVKSVVRRAEKAGIIKKTDNGYFSISTAKHIYTQTRGGTQHKTHIKTYT